MDEQNGGYLYYRIVLHNKREQTIDACNMAESQNNDTKGKSGGGKYIFYDSIYVELETANEPVLADQLRLGMERGILGGGLLWCLRR